MKRNKGIMIIRRAISIAICAVLCFNVFNFGAFADGAISNREQGCPDYFTVLKPSELESQKRNTQGDMTLQELAVKELSLGEIPEVIDPRVTEENDNVNRLWEQEPDLNTVIFQNRDGKKTLYSFALPVKYTDKDGNIKDKSNELSSFSDKKGYSFVNKGNDIKTYYPSVLSKDKGLVLEYEDIQVELSPISVKQKQYVMSDGSELTLEEYGALQNNVQIANNNQTDMDSEKSNSSIIDNETPKFEGISEIVKYSTPASANKKQISDNSGHLNDAVTYGNVFGENTSIYYASTFEGFKEDIIINENIGINNFSFKLKTGGLSLELSKEGQYYLAEPLTGECKAVIGSLEITDSKQQIDIDAITPKSEYNHYYQVETVVQNDEYIITVVVDESFLSAPETIYPVKIDPTITVNRAQINDATLYSGKPTRQAGLIENYLYAGYDGSGGYGKERFLIKSPVLIQTLAAAGVTSCMITDAKLRMYNASTASSSSHISISMFDNAWQEGTVSYSSVNWNDLGEYQDYANVTNYAGYYWWDITSAVQTWRADCNFNNGGLMVMADDEYIVNKEHKFCASDSTNNSVRPFMEVTYWVGTGLPTEVIPRDGACWCWNACAEMVSRSMYPDVGTKTQDQAFNYVKDRPLSQTITSSDKTQGGEAPDVDKAIQYFTNNTMQMVWWGNFDEVTYVPLFVSSDPSTGRLSETSLQSLFEDGKPVVIYVRPYTNVGEGHLVVLAGYNSVTERYTILNPNNTSGTSPSIMYATYAQLTNNTQIKAYTSPTGTYTDNVGSEGGNVWVATMAAFYL